MKEVPRTAYDQVGGMTYFPRMLDKIRLHDRGRLREDFHDNLGRGADGWCCGFLHVDYGELKARVLEGGSDEEILEWCFSNGRKLNDTDLMVWNAFLNKLGWRDELSERLEQVKRENGLGGRDDILTMPEFYEVDEGRKP